jgi:mono/diheme cytochrome c family protein
VRRIAVVLGALAFALGGVACGGGDDNGDAGNGDTAGGTASGEAVFTDNCGSCHTLSAAGTSGTTGPNLDDLQPDRDRVEEQVRNGGGGMPAFEGQLTDAQIDTVADYVADSAGG